MQKRNILFILLTTCFLSRQKPRKDSSSGLSRRSHHLSLFNATASPSLTWSAARRFLSFQLELLMMICCVVSLQTAQHLYPRPPLEPRSRRIYIRMKPNKPPMCVGSGGVNWGSSSSRQFTSRSVNESDNNQLVSFPRLFESTTSPLWRGVHL